MFDSWDPVRPRASKSRLQMFKSNLVGYDIHVSGLSKTLFKTNIFDRLDVNSNSSIRRLYEGCRE